MDPVRAQIFFEIMLQTEITANQLMNRLTINRSTLTHHLVKMEEARLIEVRIQTKGRPVKYYKLSKEQNRKVEFKMLFPVHLTLVGVKICLAERAGGYQTFGSSIECGAENTADQSQ